MSTIRLGDFITEVTEKTIVNNQYRVLTSSQDGIVSQDEYFNKHVASKDTTGYKIIRKGQFTYRAMSDTGRFYINQLSDYDIGIVSPAYPVFEIKDNYILYPAFLQAFFRSDYFQSLIANQSWGSTRVSLKLDIIKKIEIFLPPLEIQHQIAQNLDKVTHLIDFCNQILDKLDLLVKSQFVEMFGEQQYSRTLLIELIVVGAGLSYGIIVPGDNIENGVPMIRPSDFKNDSLCLDNVYRVAPEIEIKYARTRLIGDEILVQVIGQPGQIMLSDKRCKGMNVTRNLAVIRPDCSRINRIYLKTYMQTQEAQTFMLGETNQSTLKQLPLSRLKNLEIPIPPLPLQNQFAAFVEQTDKSKLAVKQVLEKAETLKKALMQEYFG